MPGAAPRRSTHLVLQDVRLEPLRQLRLLAAHRQPPLLALLLQLHHLGREGAGWEVRWGQLGGRERGGGGGGGGTLRGEQEAWGEAQ